MRVFIAVDVSNLYYCIKSRHGATKRLNYQKLYSKCQEYGDINYAYAYASEMFGAGEKFFECLGHIGFKVKLTPVKEFIDFKKNAVCPHCAKQLEPVVKYKADWDVGIAVDVARIIDRIDVLVLCTADGDMAQLVKYAKDQGVIVHIIGCGVQADLKIADSVTEISSVMLDERRPSSAIAIPTK